MRGTPACELPSGLGWLDCGNVQSDVGESASYWLRHASPGLVKQLFVELVAEFTWHAYSRCRLVMVWLNACSKRHGLWRVPCSRPVTKQPNLPQPKYLPSSFFHLRRLCLQVFTARSSLAVNAQNNAGIRVIMNYLSNAVSDTRNDYTWNSAIRLTAKGARALPTASAHYAVDKLPIIGWLPRYNYRWLINDVIAGLTVGLMLIPQGLSYAKIAKIPVEYGLMSSWFPPGLYAFMGTTKGGSPKYQDLWLDY